MCGKIMFFLLLEEQILYRAFSRFFSSITSRLLASFGSWCCLMPGISVFKVSERPEMTCQAKPCIFI